MPAPGSYSGVFMITVIYSRVPLYSAEFHGSAIKVEILFETSFFWPSTINTSLLAVGKNSIYPEKSHIKYGNL